MSRVSLLAGRNTTSPSWVHWIADHSNLVRTMRWPYGDWSLEFDADFYASVAPEALQQGSTVEAYLCGTLVFGGVMDEPGFSGGRFAVAGHNRASETAYAVNGSWQAVADLDTAMAAQRSAGFTRFPAAGSDSTVTGLTQLPAPTEVNILGGALDQWALLNGRSWWVDSYGVFRHGAAPEVPALVVDSSALEGIDVATDLQATDIIVGYYKTPGLTYATARAETAGAVHRRARLVDLTGIGPITTGAAQTYADNLRAAATGKPRFTGSITVAAGQVANLFGVAVHPAQMLPGRMYRLSGMRDPRTGALSTDVVMGEAVWDEDAGTVQLTPLDADRDDFQASIEQIGGRAV